LTISLAIKNNETFTKNGSIYRYAMEMPLSRMLFMPTSLDSGAEFTCTEVEFEDMLARREVVRYHVLRDADGNIIKETDNLETSPGSEESVKAKNARALFFYLQRWHMTPTRPSSLYWAALEGWISRQIKDATKAGHEWVPSRGTMHRYINRFPNIQELSSRFLISRTGDTTRERWHPAVANILEKIIDYYWETGSGYGRNHIATYAEFSKRFDATAAEVGPTLTEPLKKPSDETVRTYCLSAESFETVAAKYGKAQADAQFAGNFHPIKATRLLDVVMIDSTVADAWCVLDDETLLPLGRPTITIAVDLFTRMVLAVVVTFEPPSLFTTMAALKRVNVNKRDINERWPKIHRTSDGWGKPTMVVVDNELSQIGKSYQAACEDAKINVRWAPIKRPQYKAVVERIFLTIKQLLLDRLPGGLPHKPDLMRRLGIDPAKISTITMDKLTELLNQAINDIYHYREHGTLGIPPALAWEKSKAKHKRPYIGDHQFLESAFGVLRDGTLTTSGLTFDRLTFHDPFITQTLLSDLACTTPRRSRRKSPLSSLNVRVSFKFNPANIDTIYVWNPKTKKYVSLPNEAGKATKGLSLWHWNILRLWAKEESVAFSSPDEQLAARVRLRENIEESIPSEAYKTIKKQRRILHEPSMLPEGTTVVMTEAPPTQSGMAADDFEIKVAAHAPDGDRIPPKGPARGGKKGKRPDKRTRRRMRDAVLDDKPTLKEAQKPKLAGTVAAFAARMKDLVTES
jgi:putative transposase